MGTVIQIKQQRSCIREFPFQIAVYEDHEGFEVEYEGNPVHKSFKSPDYNDETALLNSLDVAEHLLKACRERTKP